MIFQHIGNYLGLFKSNSFPERLRHRIQGRDEEFQRWDIGTRKRDAVKIISKTYRFDIGTEQYFLIYRLLVANV